jgi:protocatechuate 3,4-dioxygenase beta subunit
MTKTIAAFAIFFAAAFAQAPPTQPSVPGQSQQTPGAPADQPKADCALLGQVLNGITGEPLRKAVVRLRGQGGQNMARQADVDSAGRFEFRNIEPGRYILTAKRTGFADQAYGAKRPGSRRGSPVSIEQGQEMKNLIIKLTPHGVVMGRLLDEDGEPKAGVSVSAMRFEWMGNRRQLSSYGSASSNDLGEYRIYGLAPGTYILQASPPHDYNFTAPDPELSAKPEEGYVTTCYPGTTDSSTAARVSVKAGTELRGFDFRMAKSHVVRVRGVVLNGATGKPVRTSLMLLPRNKGYSAWMEMKQAVVMDQHGTFEFKNVSPGSYTLRGTVMSQETRLGAVQTLDVGDDHIRNLVVTLNPGSEIPGTLKIEGQEQIDSSASPVHVSLAPWGSEDDGMSGAYAEVNDDGSFKLTEVQPARYRVRASGVDGAYLKAARWGDQDVVGSGLDLSQGMAGGALELVMSKKAPEVSGTVQSDDGKHLTGATVVLLPDEQHRDQFESYPSSTTDQNGAFTVKNVRPGKYKVLAWEELEGSEYMDPEFTKPFEGKAVSVSLDEGAKEALQLTAIQADAAAREKEDR